MVSNIDGNKEDLICQTFHRMIIKSNFNRSQIYSIKINQNLMLFQSY
ncbi:unnamed protein product [Paramecium sonneborni]|uniref:Uncharacterized protein n=1 Tax=Paramecium sonneborni TaxID=65129 RepID=A0A8S1NHQ6_9CILI|nr:unnamed protein product [Paramecium sonneborni]